MKQKLRMKWRLLRVSAHERAIDLWCMAWPIFAITGVVVAAFKFWWWLL